MAKPIKVDDETHARFKAACALRGVQMQKAATEALEALMVWDDLNIPLSLSEFLALAGAGVLHGLAHGIKEKVSEAATN